MSSKWRWKEKLNNGDSVTMRALTGFDYIPEGQIPILQFYDETTEITNPVDGRVMTGPEIAEGIKRAILVLTRCVVQYHELQDDGHVIDKRIVNKDPMETDIDKEISVYELPDEIQLEIMAAQAKHTRGSGVPDAHKFPGNGQPDSGAGRDGSSIRDVADSAAEDAIGNDEPESADIPEG